MSKNRFIFGAAVLIAALFFTACPDPNGADTDDYTVTITKPEHGNITANPIKGPSGTLVTIEADPDEGFQLKELTVNGTAKTGAGPWEITLTENVTLAAVFEELITYTVTITPPENGSITTNLPIGQEKIPEGTVITIQANPVWDYRLKELTVNDEAQTGAGPWTIILTKDIILAAEFEPEPKYTVTITPPQNGSITTDPQSGPGGIPEGTAITIQAYPAAGYRLQELKANETAIDITGAGPWAHTLTVDVTLTAEFEELPAYNVTITPPENGSITTNPPIGQEKIPEGTVITIQANPVWDYRLKELTVNGEAQTGAGPWTITLTKDVTLAAVFEAIPKYKVTITQPQNGSITASPQNGPEGTEITIQAYPATGYRLKELKAGATAINISAAGPWTHTLTGDVTLAAEFEAIPVYTVTITKPENGNITANPRSGEEGTIITLTLTPASGYWLKEGSLKYNDGSADVPITGTTFTLPAADVTVTAEFETKNVADLIDAGTDALVDGKFDNAIAAFDSAYEQSRADKEAIIYSSLARLASIAKDQNVRNLVKDRLGFTGYPGTIDSLISGEWLETYTEESLVYWYYEGNKYYEWHDPEDEWDAVWFDLNGLEPIAGYYYHSGSPSEPATPVSGEKETSQRDFDDDEEGTWICGTETPRYDSWAEKMPGLSLPSWFANTGIYQDNLTSAGALKASAWPLLLFANLVEKNQDGLNGLLDDTLSSVFGDAFENAAGRFKDLPYDQSVEVDEDLLEAFGLSEVLEGDKIYVGKAELDLLFSAVRLFKASLEWVAAYDWNTDISFLRTDWKTLDDNMSSLSPQNLPFGNNFMKDRNNGMMGKSKDDFGKAITAAINSYDHLIGTSSKLPGAYIDEMKEYQWLKDGLSKLRTAIQNGEVFYAKEPPSGNSYDNSATDAFFGINLGKLFNPGQFSIDQLIETESGGNAPRFYAFDGDGEPTPITSKAQFDTLNEYVGFKIKFGRITEALIAGSEGSFPDEEVIPMFPALIGKELYGLYHK
jgi:hypothetical protein